MSTPPPRKDNDNNDKRPEKRKPSTTEDGEAGGLKRRGTEDAVDGVGMAAILALMQQQAAAQAVRDAAQAERDRRMMEMLEASRVPPPNLAPVVPSRFVPPSRTPSPPYCRGDYAVPVSEARSTVPSEELRRQKEDKGIMSERGRKAEKEKKRKDRKKEKRRGKLAEDASDDQLAVEVTEFPGDEACEYCRSHKFPCRITVIAGAPSKRKAGPGPLRSACDVCKKRKSACDWPGVKKAPKKSKPTAGKKKSVVVSSDSEVEEIAPIVVPCTCIDHAAEHLSEVERRLADVSGVEEEASWMQDAMLESRRIAEEFVRRSDGQGGLGLTAEEKEEMEKKKKCAEVDALADTDGGSEKSDDAEDSPKVKEEKMDEGESWGEEFRRAHGRTPLDDAEVIVITDSEDEEDLREIRGKHAAKGKGKAKCRVESDDEGVDSPKNSEDEENTDPDADAEEDVVGKQMSEPPIVTEDVPKSDE
ncbi:hypothetical protein B0H19DRAFT_1257042 [Mycena capillaripes]|nr:hypothetical protein B0H19DRAFT_1257042 [Mycena capillaripes]